MVKTRQAAWPTGHVGAAAEQICSEGEHRRPPCHAPLGDDAAYFQTLNCWFTAGAPCDPAMMKAGAGGGAALHLKRRP